MEPRSERVIALDRRRRGGRPLAPLAVTSIDAMVEGVHFRLGDAALAPEDIGHRALAAALSDLAAMAADPGEAYVALGGTAAHVDDAGVLGIARGMESLAARDGDDDRRRRPRGRRRR